MNPVGVKRWDCPKCKRELNRINNARRKTYLCWNCEVVYVVVKGALKKWSLPASIKPDKGA